MVSFNITAGGYKVVVNKKHFGYISKELGFFTDPTVIKRFIAVSKDDLRLIADASEEVQKGERL